MMNICIDARTITESKTGVGNYTYNLVQSLPGYVNGEIKYITTDKHAKLLHTNKELIILNNFTNKLGRVYQENLLIPKKLKGQNIDLVHFPAFTMPIYKGNYKTILTVHDLAMYKYPEMFRRLHVLGLKARLPVLIKIADRILVDSNSTKIDLIEIFKVDDKKVHVVYPGIPHTYKEIPDSEFVKEVYKKYNIAGKFILGVGTENKRKNIHNLIKAFSYVRNKYNLDISLVLVGNGPVEFKPDNLSKYMENKIIYTGYIDNKTLSVLYTAAEVFVYPSLYEGFGFPPLESMVYGTPVIVSNISSLPEVVGDSGVLVDPYNYMDIGEQVFRLISNRDLYLRMKLKGYKQSQKFTWERTCEKLMSIYEEVVN